MGDKSWTIIMLVSYYAVFNDIRSSTLKGIDNITIIIIIIKIPRSAPDIVAVLTRVERCSNILAQVAIYTSD